jgi:hypothetical protein
LPDRHGRAGIAVEASQPRGLVRDRAAIPDRRGLTHGCGLAHWSGRGTLRGASLLVLPARRE